MVISHVNKSPMWVRGCRIGPMYPPVCLIGSSLCAMGCDPCQWKRGSWLLSQYFVAALKRQYTALASISTLLQNNDGLIILIVFNEGTYR